MKNKIKENYKKIIVVVVMLLFILSLFFINFYNNKQKEKVKVKSKTVVKETIEKKKKEVKEEKINYYYVDIKGAVKNPGVYKIEEGKRIIDQTTPNMIQRISEIFERKPLISKEI